MVTALACAPDGEHFAWSDGSRLALCRTAGGAVFRRVLRKGVLLRALAFSADSGHLAFIDGEQPVVFDLGRGTLVVGPSLLQAREAVGSVAFAAPGWRVRMVRTVFGEAGRVSEWWPADGSWHEVRLVEGMERGWLSEDGRLLAWTRRTGLSFLDLETGEAMGAIETPGIPNLIRARFLDDEQVAAVDVNGQAKLFAWRRLLGA
ncbi:MAG: hypothetical protein K2W96_04540 [Gemmataceae bacterium]|nr:hypothetical protein [Gemmataceae bacterium]